MATVDGDAVSRSMSLYLRSNPAIDYGRVHEVRFGLEIQIAELAAETSCWVRKLGFACKSAFS